MIQNSEAGFEVTCDGRTCQEFLEVDSPGHDFNDVLQSLRDNGWAWRRDRHGDWEHFCPDCK